MDHPRSRGVYNTRGSFAPLEVGSSPLARGLPTMALAWAALLRIIPARAGFTPRRAPRENRTRDHPRSRGVYAHRARPAAPARGIIPARAGFTCTDTNWRSWPTDHPRSRGVYSLVRSRAGAGAGSSPLARGLLRAAYAAKAARRIIPARAGFTGLSDGRHSEGPDHPRSRGVYSGSPPRRTGVSGSSPLARGLPRSMSPAPAHPGIIPARAGFTGRDGDRCVRARDHPRSRGVYGLRGWPRSRKEGSSPLARGLRVSPARGRRRRRIIPARAGFTHGAVPDGPGGADHPRSRGVYPARTHL